MPRTNHQTFSDHKSVGFRATGEDWRPLATLSLSDQPPRSATTAQ
ncbi:hypothetical protein A2U01_0096121, partial [Trifolium medium]|nr:hypothetical protein [Trifolium medium]